MWLWSLEITDTKNAEGSRVGVRYQISLFFPLCRLTVFRRECRDENDTDKERKEGLEKGGGRAKVKAFHTHGKLSLFFSHTLTHIQIHKRFLFYFLFLFKCTYPCQFFMQVSFVWENWHESGWVGQQCAQTTNWTKLHFFFFFSWVWRGWVVREG